MDLDQYLYSNGFDRDPFASTNADTEDFLQDYFVPPPYFDSVLGQPTSPESHIVFAPRGGGKSAQRRMIEIASESGDFLCVLHDNFPVDGVAAVRSITLDVHLKEIARKLLVALLVHLDEAPGDARRLDKSTRAGLVMEAGFLFGSLSADEFRREVQSLKSMGKRTGEWLKAHSGPIRPIITAIFKKAELEPPDFALSEDKSTATPTESWKYRVERLVNAALSLGYKSVYVLVDKVDELPETSSDPSLALALVAPLITSLPIMELHGVGFKVFLWDRTQEEYLDRGGRPDRVKDFTLGWDQEALAKMMTRRLRAHSSDRVQSLDQLVKVNVDLGLHRLATELAHGSPRDMVRLVKEICDVHLNQTAPSGRFDTADIFRGIGLFSSRIASERSRKYMPDLLKINSYRFTQGRLANDLLKIRKQSAQAKVVEWRKTGLIEKIAELQDSRNRPQHLYGVVDIRLAIAMRQDIDAETVLASHVVLCPACAKVNIVDESPVVCAECKNEFSLSGATSVLASCRR